MFDAILTLPYVHYWLPAAAALGLSVPVYLIALRPWQRRTPSAPVAEPVDKSDPFTSGSTSEQRVAFRREGNPVEVVYVENEHDEPRRGLVLDRSMGGLRLMITRDLAPGTVIAVRPVGASPMVPWVQVEVRSSRRSDVQHNEYDVGCQFVKTPPYPVLLLFG